MFILKRIKNKIFPTVQSKRVKPWFLANGDKTLRLNYDLDETSVVFDLGGYEGQWASDIFSKYMSRVFVFEPYVPYALKIEERFKMNPNIRIFSFGLGKENKIVKLFSDNDASSVFKTNGQSYDIEIKKASSFIAEKEITKIDLMKINIEGGEYELLEELISAGAIRNIRNIQVQFHDFVEHADQRMQKIQDSLAQTHKLSYQYKYVWENWELKKGPNG